MLMQPRTRNCSTSWAGVAAAGKGRPRSSRNYEREKSELSYFVQLENFCSRHRSHRDKLLVIWICYVTCSRTKGPVYQLIILVWGGPVLAEELPVVKPTPFLFHLAHNHHVGARP